MEKLILLDVNTISDELYNSSLLLLSRENKDKVLSYKQANDQLLSLGARLLERKFIIEDIYKSSSGKPLSKTTHFNISHCFPYVVLYMNDSCEVGVDIEKDKNLSETLLSNCFNKNELTDKSPVQLWTLKEAYLKYTGIGIKKNLMDLSINFVSKTKLNIGEDVFYKTFNFNGYYISLISKNEITVSDITEISIEKIL